MAVYSIERILPTELLHNCEARDTLQNDASKKSLNISNQIYIAVRGADIIFPYNECHRYSKPSHKSMLSQRIQKLLEAILEILRPQDTMKIAVRLESQLSSKRTRYLLVVSNETDQSCLLGIDYENEVTIGLVLPILNDMQIKLDGDGGFRITSSKRHHIFKPVSVQAMWSSFQALILATKKSSKNNYYEGCGSHSWVSYYQKNIKSNSYCLHEWHAVTDLSETSKKLYDVENKPKEQLNFEELITSKLKEVMMAVDLEQVTSKEIRNQLEEHFQSDLTEYKSYIDTEMIRIMGQMEEASKILDYLYLGSEWNASNFEELKGKGVKKILNVTYEIDNYFPAYFDYYNIRVDDDEDTNMLRHLNETYCYISKAKDEGQKVLVHCKKGISRSACVVVAYIMKEKSYDLNEALKYVKNHRSNIRPNPEFLKQLEIYQGMLHASNNKNNIIWRSNSESDLYSNLEKSKSKSCDDTRLNIKKGALSKHDDESILSHEIETSFRFHRRRSWPPKQSSESELILFGNKSTTVDTKSDQLADDDGYLNYRDNEENEDNEDNEDADKKSVEIKSRVKERIEDFENKQPTSQTRNSSLFKKNFAKNGLVSNLACQFESRDKETVNDVVDLQPPNQRHSKPPLPPGKLSKEEQYEQLTNNLKYYTINHPKVFHPTAGNRCEYSNRILKRTLSFDNIYDIGKSRFDSNNTYISSLKKSKKSFVPKLQLLEHGHHCWWRSRAQLCKTLSLPNMYVNWHCLPRKMQQPNLLSHHQSHFTSPLDLYYCRTHLHKQIESGEDVDGFVKRRTEELESKTSHHHRHHRQHSAAAAVCKSSSLPSSPNFNAEPFNDQIDKAFTGQQATAAGNSQIKTSKSFHFVSHKKSNSDSSNSQKSADRKHFPNLEYCDGSGRILKKTYGKSHPLDKLKRNGAKASK